MSKKYAVIGSSAIDIFAVSKFFSSQKTDEHSLINFEHGSQIWLDNAIYEVGGNGLLAAITIARQSNKVDLFTKISSDIFGKTLEATAKEEKISLKGDYVSAKQHTDTTIHMSSSGKDQTQLLFAGSFSDFSKKSLPPYKNDINYLHITNITSDKNLLIKLVKWCNKNNVKLSANLQYINVIPTRLLLRFFKQCNVVILNHDEACLLVGGFCSAMQAAQKLFEQGISHCVIFGDKAESVTCIDGKIFSASINIKSNTLEYTGVEAVFAAAYIEEYYKSSDVKKSLTRAITQAVSVMTIFGARSGILYNPVRKEMNVRVYSLETEEL